MTDDVINEILGEESVPSVETSAPTVAEEKPVPTPAEVFGKADAKAAEAPAEEAPVKEPVTEEPKADEADTTEPEAVSDDALRALRGELETAKEKALAADSLHAELNDLREQLQGIKDQAVREDLGRRFGLAESMWGRIQGETPEAMEADAKQLREELGANAPKSLGRGGMDPTQDALPNDPDQLAAWIHGDDNDLF